MKDFVKELKKYFEGTSKEKVLKDWNKTEEYDNIGGVTFDTFDKLLQNNRVNIEKDK